MKRTELRIGNYVNMNGIAVQITPMMMDQEEEFYTKEIAPIDLDDRWLIKFNFRKWNTQKGTVYSKKNLILHKRKRGFVIKKAFTEPKYVHQIQNMYFELMNHEELI